METLDRQTSLRLIFTKLQRYMAVQNVTDLSNNSSSQSSSSSSANGDQDLVDDDFLQKFQEIRRKRDSYVNGTVEIGVHFGRTYITLGAVAIALNLTILLILIIHRRHMFKNVFYLLIFNFALIDLIKAVCLITYAMRLIKSPGSTKSALITSFKFDQYMTLIFRFCNMATILNLLMITLNEFIFIKFPLRYHQIVNKKSVIFCIFLNWTMCLVFTIGSTFAKGTGDRVFVSANYTSEFINSSSPTSFDNTKIKRNDLSSDKMEIHYIFAFTITAFCMLCLLAVIVCYAIFFRVIREIRLYDARLYNDANRRMSEMSMISENFATALMHHTGPNGVAVAMDERRIKRQLLKRYKYVLVIGSVICIYMLYLLTYSGIQIFQYLHLSNEKSFASDPVEHRKSYVVRWILQILVGLHSIFQPLCYFRMKEFRHFINKAFGYPCKRGQYHQSQRDGFNSFIDQGVHVPPAITITKCNTPPTNNGQKEKEKRNWYYRLIRQRKRNSSNDFSASRRSSNYYYCDPTRRISNESGAGVGGDNDHNHRQKNGTVLCESHQQNESAEHSPLSEKTLREQVANGTQL